MKRTELQYIVKTIVFNVSIAGDVYMKNVSPLVTDLGTSLSSTNPGEGFLCSSIDGNVRHVICKVALVPSADSTGELDVPIASGEKS